MKRKQIPCTIRFGKHAGGRLTAGMHKRIANGECSVLPWRLRKLIPRPLTAIQETAR